MDGFVADVGNASGIDLRTVDPLTTVLVRTRNSRYRILVRDHTSAIVQGGAFFAEPTPARIDGSGFGGSLLKVGWIGIGLHMEIFANGERIITTAVRDISIEPQPSLRPH
jgi:hypothetical protein